MIEILSNKTKKAQVYLKEDKEFSRFSDPKNLEVYALVSNKKITGIAVEVKDWANTNVFTNFKEGFIHLNVKDHDANIFKECIDAIKKSFLYKISPHIVVPVLKGAVEAREFFKSEGFDIYDESIYMKLDLKNEELKETGALGFSLKSISSKAELDEFLNILIGIYEGSADLPVIRMKDFLERKPSLMDKMRVFEAGFLKSAIYYIYLEKKIIGLLQIDESSGFVANVGFLKEFRQMGFGKIAMKFALNRFKEKGCPFSNLRVYSKNISAIKLYEKLGYVVERNIVGFFK